LLGEEDVKLYAGAHRLSEEEAARILRYRFLFEQARQMGAQAVAVAHSADDQVETVLMHLLRGSGLAGLKGMQFFSLPNAWSQKIPLVRPLLEFWRDEILAYCEEHGLSPVLDPSNRDLSHFRNRLRLELIPVLEDYNPSIRRILWRTAEVLKGDFEIVEGEVDESWLACVSRSGEGFTAFDFQELERQKVGIQRHLFRRAIAALQPGIRDIHFEAIERALQYLNDPARPDQIDLIGHLRLVSEPGRLWIAAWDAELPSDEWPQLKDKESLRLQLPGTLELPGGWQLRISSPSDARAALREAEANADPYRAWLAVDPPQARLILRPSRPGERFRPMGMVEGSMKLSDFMINQKVPRRARPGWPLVDVGGEVAWVPGYRVGQGYRLTPESKFIVHFSFARSSQH
jgi:tRNA(Ile)-lysidine synthase